MALLYADEHFPAPAVAELRRLGHAVLTLNRRDFIRAHGHNPHHAGIIVCTQNLDFTQLASRIHDAASAAESIAGRVIRVYRPQA